MLKEVELIVGCLNIEVITVNRHRTRRTFAEWRIGKDDIKGAPWLLFQRVTAINRTIVCAYTMKIKVHRSQRDNEWSVVHTKQRFIL